MSAYPKAVIGHHELFGRGLGRSPLILHFVRRWAFAQIIGCRSQAAALIPRRGMLIRGQLHIAMCVAGHHCWLGRVVPLRCAYNLRHQLRLIFVVKGH